MEGSEVPVFQSLEEEREYWEAHGPLAEGHKGRLNKPVTKQKRSSFLVIRLTGEELTHLRDIAAEQGLGPSTFARLLLEKYCKIASERCNQDVVQLSILNKAENETAIP